MMLPPLGVVGTYRFSSPVSTQLGDERIAVTEAILSIESLEQDPDFTVVKTVYLDIGLTDTDFNSDKLNRIPILKMRFSDDKIHYVPTTYVITFPSTAGIPYQGTALAVTLGMLPSDFSLTALKQYIESLCLNRYGLEAETTEVAVSAEVRLLEYEHRRLEDQRVAKILPEELPTTNLYDIEKLQIALKRSEQQIRYLESYILRCMHCKPCEEITERVNNDLSLLESCGSFESPNITHDADDLFLSEEITYFKN